MTDIRLRVENLDKSFPGVKALSDVSFAIRRGSVHALCGENGAGKSTLVKIINGLYQPDAGRILLNEQPVNMKSPMVAAAHGIAMIPQELNFVPNMTIAESFFMGGLPRKCGRVDWRRIRKETRKILDAEQLTYSVNQKLGSLTVSDIQMLEILKAVHRKADIIIMDEPTSAIAQKEVDVLFRKIRELRQAGASIVYISHKMDEVFAIADEVTVLRDGQVVSTDRACELDLDTVITRMVGRRLDNKYPKKDLPVGDVVFRAKGLHRKNMFVDIDIEVRAGEIVGLAGLVGAGRSEVVQAIFGLDPLDEGGVQIDGESVQIKNPQRAIEQGLAMLPEDRRLIGIIPKLSVRLNATIASLGRVVYKGRSHRRQEKEIVTEYFERMRVRTPTLETPIESLSGGNQQKVLLAKWLLTDPKVLLLDEPTRGIDVGAKFEIYRLMNELAAQGRGILMISSELPELMGMCDRIYVMSQGRLTGEIQRADFDSEHILRCAMSEID